MESFNPAFINEHSEKEIVQNACSMMRDLIGDLPNGNAAQNEIFQACLRFFHELEDLAAKGDVMTTQSALFALNYALHSLLLYHLVYCLF